MSHKGEKWVQIIETLISFSSLSWTGLLLSLLCRKGETNCLNANFQCVWKINIFLKLKSLQCCFSEIFIIYIILHIHKKIKNNKNSIMPLDTVKDKWWREGVFRTDHLRNLNCHPCYQLNLIGALLVRGLNHNVDVHSDWKSHPDLTVYVSLSGLPPL